MIWIIWYQVVHALHSSQSWWFESFDIQPIHALHSLPDLNHLIYKLFMLFVCNLYFILFFWTKIVILQHFLMKICKFIYMLVFIYLFKWKNANFYFILFFWAIFGTVLNWNRCQKHFFCHRLWTGAKNPTFWHPSNAQRFKTDAIGGFLTDFILHFSTSESPNIKNTTSLQIIN